MKLIEIFTGRVSMKINKEFNIRIYYLLSCIYIVNSVSPDEPATNNPRAYVLCQIWFTAGVHDATRLDSKHHR